MENREVKSDVFSMLMENKDNALQVFNALNGSAYTNAEMVEIVTLEKGISLTVRNDAAFIVDMNLNIYEHQSTFSPNIPIRSLLYLAEILKPLVKSRDIYGRKKVLIPAPRFVVFYNGIEDRTEQETLRLSDLFSRREDNPEIELKCTVYNINSEKGSSFLSKCRILNEYTQFIERIRYYESEGNESPIKAAIDWCVENHILEEFLRARGQEVAKTMTLDMTFERREEIIRNEALEEGIKEGIKEGQLVARRDIVMELLEDKGTVPADLKEKIESEDNLERISTWCKTAAKCDSVENFICLIGE